MPSLPPHTDSCSRKRSLDIRYESRSAYNKELIALDMHMIKHTIPCDIYPYDSM
jgi:hypothetical protein